MKIRGIISFAVVISGLAFSVPAGTFYVSATSGNDTNSGTSWAEAKATIQAAVDDAGAGDLVLVTNGVYDTGGRPADGLALTNRLVIDKAVTVASVNGSGVTTIQGAQDPGTIDGFGDAAIRCVWMTNDATLVGFTLQGGFTREDTAYLEFGGPDFSGGGLYAVSDLAVVSNCVLSGNSAFHDAGGAFRGTLLGCILVSNTASQGGAASESTLHDCAILDNEAAVGGGVRSCMVSGSVLAGNIANVQHGGGALSSDLEDCLVIGNRTQGGIGGGANGGSLKNCTVVGNEIVGVANASVTNCIIYFNTGFEPGVDDNYYHSFESDIHFSCTFPMPTNGTGNITNNPGFVDLAASNLQLSASSPCRDAGLLMGTASATDLAGNPRLVHGFIDMGAYEFQGGAGPADYDGDGYGNGEEQIAGTDLADPESFFRVDLLVSTNGLALVFDSVTNRIYAVEHADDLTLNSAAWIQFSNNITGSGLNIEIPVPFDAAARGFRARAGLVAEATNAPPAPVNMSLIPAGAFVMGDTFGDGLEYELPLHSVTISAFYMDKYEVTQGLWDEVKAFNDGNSYSYSNTGQGKAPSHPVHTVSWYDVVKWCNARSEMDGLTPVYYTDTGFTTVYKTGEEWPYADWSANGYRLPTEAEWEKAARGGVAGQRFPWGDTITHDDANYLSSSSSLPAYDTSSTSGYHPEFNDGDYPYTSPVGYFAPNGYGLFDMAGNIHEWCWDWLSESYYESSLATDPRGPDFGDYGTRVLRGGSWAGTAGFMRVADRFNKEQYYVRSDIGFRCVRGL